MSGFRTVRRAAEKLLIALLLTSSILVSIGTNSVNSHDVTVSPGEYDLKLGDSFPTFGGKNGVKLSYPNSSILTNSVGDLLFTVTLQPDTTQPWCDPYNLTQGNCRLSVDIYIPPDFSGLTIGNLWTSFTNNYDHHSMSLSRQSSSDQIGPNWWKITISDLNFTYTPSRANSTNRVFLVTLPTNMSKPQYVRLFQVTSPTTAGRYFFKAFINGISIGAKNFPTLVVKASRDPAYISGRLRDLGDRNVTNAGGNITLPEGYGAQVVATGIDYLGNPVSAQTFINSTARGQYTLFGVAPGTYNITAYAAGYIPTTRPNTVSVAAAQSLESVDIYMTRSVNITGRVLSETAGGIPLQWGNLSALVLLPNGTTITKPTSRAISIKLLNLDGTVAASIPPPYGFAKNTDPASEIFDFSIQHEVGFDGRIPQDHANYTSGLEWGDFLLQAYVTSYVQLQEVRVHVADETTQTRSVIPLIRTGTFNVTVHFKNSIASTIWADPVSYNGTLSVSAYDQQGMLKAQNQTFVVVKPGQLITSVSVELQGFSNARSFGTASLFQQNYGILPGTYYIKARFTSSPLITGNTNIGVADLYFQTTDIQATIGLGEGIVELSLPMYKAGGLLLALRSIDTETPPLSVPWRFPNKTINILIMPAFSLGAVYQTNATQLEGKTQILLNLTGLPTGSYDLITQTLGYTQREVLHFNVVLGQNTDASVWMIENPTIDLTVVFRNEGLLSIINSTQPYARPINHLDATPARVEVFDDLGNFVAANVSYIPNNSTGGTPTRIANFTLAGFDSYYGDPRFVWSGFYDTTDSTSQNPGGLLLYPWEFSAPYHEFTVRVWVEGYYQLEPLHVVVPTRGNASATVFVDRASRISGTVIGPDFYDEARPLSWATISLEPNNYTVTGIIDVRPGNYTTSSLDGSFQLWVPQGSYGMGVSLAGYASYSAQIAVPSGSDISMQIWLDNYQSSSQAMTLKSSANTIIAMLTTRASISGLSNRLLRKT